MNIVVLDSQPLDAENDLDWSPVRALGTLTLFPQTSPEQVAERIQDADIVLTNKVILDNDTLTAANRLRLISVLATGTNNIDLEAARRHDIVVCNVPGYSTASTAQTTIALLLELCHGAGNLAESVRNGEWTRRGVWSFWHDPPVELDGKTLLIVGRGQIGTRVARIACALGMTVIAAQLPGRERTESGIYPRRPLNDALPGADVVTLHCPLTPQTRHLFDAKRLARLKPGAFLLNTARGPLVDETAVAAALHTGQLGGYAADVLGVEPPAPDNPLLLAPNCIITPHVAWASRESRARLLEETTRNLRAFLANAPRHVVT